VTDDIPAVAQRLPTASKIEAQARHDTSAVLINVSDHWCKPPDVSWWTFETPDDIVKCSIERSRRLDNVVKVAVMPDVHLGRETCVGVAIATSDLVYPDLVGGDIGCGMLAMAFDTDADDIRKGEVAGKVLLAFKTSIPTSRRHQSHFASMAGVGSLFHPSIDAFARSEGAAQLCTLRG